MIPVLIPLVMDTKFSENFRNIYGSQRKVDEKDERRSIFNNLYYFRNSLISWSKHPNPSTDKEPPGVSYHKKNEVDKAKWTTAERKLFEVDDAMMRIVVSLGKKIDRKYFEKGGHSEKFYEDLIDGIGKEFNGDHPFKKILFFCCYAEQVCACSPRPQQCLTEGFALHVKAVWPHPMNLNKILNDPNKLFIKRRRYCK